MKFTFNLQLKNNKMSIYSGFATRFQQQAYDHCVDSLIYILQKRIIKFYQKEEADEEKFVALVLKLHHQLKGMEKNKYLDPKSSRSIEELVKFIQQINPSSFSNPQPSGNLQPLSPPQPAPQQLPAPLPQITNDKKKNTFWVEKQPAQVESVKTVTQQEVQTLGTINKQANSDNMQSNHPFKRTHYQPPNIRAFNPKATSRSNLSRERKDDSASGMLENEQNGRSMSNYIQQKPSIHSKVTYYPTSAHSNHIQKRKSQSNTRVHPHVEQNNQNHNEVADIIKDYIVKVKRGYNRTHKGKDFRNSINKLQDF